MVRRSRSLLARGAALLFSMTLVFGVSSAVAEGPTKVSDKMLDQLSQSVVLQYYVAHPDQAPSRLRQAMEQIRDLKSPKGRNVNSCTSNANKDVFNCDIFGLPQNEESVGSCPTNDNLVLEGTNDYRGLIDPEGNFTGWHWSIDGGHSVQNEGLLPPVSFRTIPGARDVPSGGDPVDFIPAGCDSVYAASLAYSPGNAFGDNNGVAVYKSTPAILSSCDAFLAGGVTNPACWPVRRLVAETDATHFLDKEWMFVGVQNGVRSVWVTYTDFAQDPSAPLGFTGAQIKAVRCDENLAVCTPPINISLNDQDVQFSDVTVGPDGRAYITWARIDGELNPEQFPNGQVFTVKERTETAPGSGVFGPEHVVYVENNAIPFGGFLHANDFRIATYPKSDVTTVNGAPRIYVIWDACKVRFLGSTCQEPQIKLSYSLDPDGTSWSAPIVLSNGGDNYFPTISADRTYTTNNLAAAWYTNYYDVGFHNAQDVQATSIDPATGQSRGLKRITGPQSNETEADPLLGGFFIGDYIEGVLIKNRYYVGYNGNWRQMQVLGVAGPPFDAAPPMNQQDNYLAITGLN
jgi:hypothetical protein